jgi:hypothetical protein
MLSIAVKGRGWERLAGLVLSFPLLLYFTHLRILIILSEKLSQVIKPLFYI